MSVDASEKPLEPGLTLLLSLFRLLQMVKIHLANNKLVVDSFAEFRQALSLICQTADSANIRLNRGRFYLNQERLNFPPGLAATVGKLAEYLQARGIVGLRFFDQEGLSDDGIIFFIRLINQAGREKDPLAWLQIECDKAKLTWVELMTDPRDAQIAGDGGGGSSAPQTTENRTQEPEVINLGDSVKSNDGDKSSDSVKQNDGGKSSDGDNPSDGLDLDGLDLSGLDLGGLDLSEGGGGETKDGGGGDGGGGDGEAGGGPAANRPAASPILDLTKTAFRQIMASTARATYSHALTSILDMTGHQQAVQKRVGLQKSKRVVQSLIDLLAKDEQMLLSLSTIRNFDDSTYVHSVNVAILAMCLGRRLGLDILTVEFLGLCGLFHDLGKVDVPVTLVTKPGALTKSEYEKMQQHVLNSVRQIIRLNADHDTKLRLLLPPFEHHLGLDRSGYPRTKRQAPLSLPGRILAIADVYDAMTSDRPYRRSLIDPDAALRHMMAAAGATLDPLILKVFIKMLGIYPVGSLLTLDTREVGLVVRTPDGAEDGRPLVLLLGRGPDGQIKSGQQVDLGEKDPRTGRFLRNIGHCLHPFRFGIQPADYLL